jgi:murein DD-endopeptidase MepM/ murein hydrolase activator NlpD
MRRRVWVLALIALSASAGASSARADGTTTNGSTTTTAAPAYSRLRPSFLPAGCVGAGEAVIAEPGRRVLALGTPASGVGPSAYPAKAPVVTFTSSAVSGSTCKDAQVTLESVSLLGGFVTASSVDATHGRGTVTGLEVDGSAVTLTAGQTVPLGYWGQLTLGSTVGRLTAPLVVQLLERHGSLPAGTTIAVAFAASSTPPAHTPQTRPAVAGSSGHRSARVHAAGAPAHRGHKGKAKRRHHRKRVPQPLKAKPSLGFKPSHYVFPVDGGASYVDTYGANRSDIYDGWHHGDDLFAPLGTPVVAVARGKLSLVGWNRLGGWRLWLTDKHGNSFYYAHLAGYSRRILHHRQVAPGQVIGFLGRTGDAFTTPPHLHFEVHPHLFHRLGYDGAVDPTTYLEKWKVVRVPGKEIPRPARLRAPGGRPAQEAAVVWRELLVARHLLPAAPAVAFDDVLRRSFPAPSSPRSLPDAAGPMRRMVAVRLAAHVTASENGGIWMILALPLGIVALFAAAFFALRRRRFTRPPLH